MDGTPEQVYAEPEKIRAAGLELPQCAELVCRLREKGIKLDGCCITPESCAELICRALEVTSNE